MKKLKIITIGLVLGFVATASTGFAGMDHGSNMTNTQTNLTAEQQQQLDTVKGKYSAQLDKLQANLNSKMTEYQNARTNESTTVGTLNKLEAEVTELRSQYWTLLDQANAEAGQSVGNGNGMWFTCGYDNCNHQNMNGNHMGMMNGGMMNGNHKGMMNGGGMMNGNQKGMMNGNQNGMMHNGGGMMNGGRNQQGNRNCDYHDGRC